MKFQFRHETVLSYRKHLKEEAEMEWSKAQQKLIQARNSLASMSQQYGEAEESLQSQLLKKISGNRIRMHMNYLNGLKERIERKDLEVLEWEKRVRKKREELARRTKDYRIVEKLKERDYQRWQVHQNRVEQKRLDELSVLRHRRQFL